MSVFLWLSQKLAAGHVQVMAKSCMVTSTRKVIYKSEGQITWVWLLDSVPLSTVTVELGKEEWNEEYRRAFGKKVQAFTIEKWGQKNSHIFSVRLLLFLASFCFSKSNRENTMVI